MGKAADSNGGGSADGSSDNSAAKISSDKAADSFDEVITRREAELERTGPAMEARLELRRFTLSSRFGGGDAEPDKREIPGDEGEGAAAGSLAGSVEGDDAAG